MLKEGATRLGDLLARFGLTAKPRLDPHRILTLTAQTFSLFVKPATSSSTAN